MQLEQPDDHPGGKPGANPKSISHRCDPIMVAIVWELTKETINLPLGCLQGGDTSMHLRNPGRRGVGVHLDARPNKVRDGHFLPSTGGVRTAAKQQRNSQNSADILHSRLRDSQFLPSTRGVRAHYYLSQKRFHFCFEMTLVSVGSAL